MSDNTLHILFGFGGSGGKTLAHLAEIMTNDPVAARKAKDRLHFVLVDTDSGELKRAEDRIREAFKTKVPGMDPKLETFLLGAGADNFPDLVSHRMEGATEEGIARLKEHWWFRTEAGPEGNVDIPFSADRMPLSVSAGAGQCPMVAHFLAWNQLRQFEELLERIATCAVNERKLEDYHIELMLVAGLAGGTGRGCWQSLALKTREYFGRQGKSCRPTGFFFDASVFADIQRGYPDQKVKLVVNSLTGLSELAMWLRSDTGCVERRVSLPDLASPANPEVDVIDTDHYMPESARARRGRSPINRAYIFSRECGIILQRSDDAYRFAAAAIYGRFAISNTRSADANTPARACATATSVLYVPICDIRRTVQLKAKAQRIEQFLEGSVGFVESAHQVQSNLVGWLNRLVAVPPSPADMIAWGGDAGANSVSPSIAGTLASPFINASRGTHLQGPIAQFNLSLTGSPSDRTGAMRALESSGGASIPDQGYRAVMRALGVAADDPDAANTDQRSIQCAAKRVWDRVVNGGVGAGGKAESLRALAGSINSSPGSIRVLQQTLGQIVQMLTDSLKSIPTAADERAAGSIEDQKRKLSDEIAKRKSPLGFLPFVPHFSHGSRATLRARAAEFHLAARMPEYHKLFRDLLSELLRRALQSQARLRAVTDAAERLRSAFERDSKDLAKDVFLGTESGSSREMVKELKSEAGIPMNRVVRRVRPIAQPERFKDLVSKALASSQGGASYAEKELLEALTKTSADAHDSVFLDRDLLPLEEKLYADRVRDRLGEMVSRQELPDELMREYTVDRVLADIVEWGCEQYSTSAGDIAFRRDLSDGVQGMTGINLERLEATRVEESKADPMRQAEKLRAPDAAVVVAEAALQLATHCDPPVTLAATREQRGDLVSVLLPDLSSEAATATKSVEDVIDSLWRNRHTEFRHVQVGSLADNPYMVVAIADLPKQDFDQQGWTGWNTFDYWRNPEVQEWLQLIEDPGGASVFSTRDNSIGLGYISPQYVRDAHWALRRWRPWFDNRRTTAQSQRKWFALAYGILGNDPYRKREGGVEEPWLKRYREFVACIAKQAAVNAQHPSERFTLPVIEERSGGTGPSFKRRLFVVDAGAVRQTGIDLIRTAEYQFKSMRSFVEWVRSDESSDVLAKLWAEQPIFCALLRGQEFYDVTSPEHRRDVNVALREYVREWREYVERSVTREDDRREQMEFLKEFADVIEGRDFDVLLPFDGSNPLA